MQRRKFIALFGGAVAAWPLAARAQQPAKLPRIALLSPGRSEPPDSTLNLLNGLEQGMQELGYKEGQNLAIERQFAQWSPDRLRELAVETARLNPDVIVAFSTPAARSQASDQHHPDRRDRHG